MWCAAVQARQKVGAEVTRIREDRRSLVGRLAGMGAAAAAASEVSAQVTLSILIAVLLPPCT